MARWTAEQLAALKSRITAEKPPARKKPAQVESKIQVAFIKWVRIAEKVDPRLRLLFSVPNGGKRGAIAAARMKMEGQRPGIPDILFPIRSGEYIGLAIEFKRPDGGRASKDQRDMIELFRNEGWLVVIHTETVAAIAEVKKYLKS